ncbi:MAG: (Fe-S)-binding protein [Thermodesulfobacteriota bacterium]
MFAGHPLFVNLFIVGSIIFLIGIALRFSLYLQGGWDFARLARGLFLTLFSPKILKWIKVLFLDGILQRRLFRQDKLRWLMKVLIMVGYPSIIIAGHLKVEVMPQFENLPHLLKFFYAPFCDYYYFRDGSGSVLPLGDALFAISFDLFGSMILAGEFIAIYRRFLLKKLPFKTSVGDIIAVNLLGGWFILRFFCEATSILTYSLPNSVAQYWFLSFGLSKLMAPLGLPWASLNDPLWSISGLFLAGLVASIPYNKKLWHIFTIPLIMLLNLMPKEAFVRGMKKSPIPLSLRDLVALDACVKCGSCVEVCPVYKQTNQLEPTMGGLFTDLKSLIRKVYGWSGKFFGSPNPREGMGKIFEQPYLCTLCGRCQLVCPAFIDTNQLRIGLREFMVEEGQYPAVINQLIENLKRVHNIVGEPSEERSTWLQAIEGIPEGQLEKRKAEVAYFVGCVGSYFPMVKKIPQSLVQIFLKAKIDVTILGGEEWCCGFPLVAAGMGKEARIFLQHNLEMMKERGIKKAVFSCPSCYHTWKEESQIDIEIFHATEFIKKLIDEGKIRFKRKAMKVTYHDPCDLGRLSGIYEPPRQILQAIPGVELIEMESHRQNSKCCGGGGDLEIVKPDLSASIAQAKIEEIKATGAEAVITACQQCIRTIQMAARKKKIPLMVMDIIELVLKSMDE